MKTIRHRILFLMTLTVAIFFGWAARWHVEEQQRLEQLTSNLKQVQTHFWARLMTQQGEPLGTLASDYTCWDELVQFTRTRSRAWADANLVTALSTYHASAIWVYGNDNALLESVGSVKDTRIPALPLPGAFLTRLFASGKFCHFFVNTPLGLMEIRGAQIYDSKDLKRAGPCYGKFFAGRLWDAGYLETISRLTESTVTLTRGQTLLRWTPAAGDDRISFAEPIRGWDGRQIATLHFEGSQAIGRLFRESTRKTAFFFFGFVAALLGLVFVCLVRWVTSPLTRIVLSLKREDPSLLQPIEREQTEFGQLAALVHAFFAQQAALVEDIHHRRIIEESLQKFASLIHNCNDFICMMTLEGEPFFVNAAGRRLIGLSSETPLPAALSDFQTPEAVTLFEEEAFPAARALGRWEGEGQLRHFLTGRTIETQINFFIVEQAQTGEPLCFATIQRDITDHKLAQRLIEMQIERIRELWQQFEQQAEELQIANQRLEAMATTDGLTGLKNQRAFQAELEALFILSRHHRRPLSLILADVDHFKQVNDAFGHPAGDEVLKTVSRLLKETCRASDFVARYGGEEFVVLLPDTDKEGARVLAERLREAIARHPWERRPVTASFGVATMIRPMVAASQLLAAADIALYASKQTGRNRVTHGDDNPERLSSAA